MVGGEIANVAIGAVLVVPVEVVNIRVWGGLRECSNLVGGALSADVDAPGGRSNSRR